MIEKTGEQPADVTPASQDAAAMAALPMVEAPAISPAVESEPTPVRVEAAAPEAPSPSATARFRSAAASQIAAARERLAQRKASSAVAVALIAGLTGALATALATSGIAYFTAPSDQSAVHARALEESVTRIEAELASLRGQVERTAKLSATQASKTGERLERIEKAQAEPAAKLSKLTETVEKLRVANATPPAPVAPPAAAAARDVTGSIGPAAAPVPMPVAKPQPAGPAIVEGWTLREVDRDAALIEGKRGLFEIVVGDSIPGVGRVEGFRKQDGRWVVVTAKGLIVSR